MDTAALRNASHNQLANAVVTLGRKAKAATTKLAALKEPAFQLMEAAMCVGGGAGAAALVAMRAKKGDSTQIMNIDMDALLGGVALAGGIAMMASSPSSKASGLLIEGGKGALAYWVGTKVATRVANSP